MRHRVRGLHADAGAVEIVCRVEQAEEAEDPLHLLVHGLAGSASEGVVRRESLAEGAEDLVRAVVAQDLGGQHRLDHLDVALDLGVGLVDLVERLDDCESGAGCRPRAGPRGALARPRGSRFGEDRRDLAARLDGHRRVGQVVAQRSHHRVAEAPQGFGHHVGQRGLADAIEQQEDEPRGCRSCPTARTASAATSGSGSGAGGELQGRARGTSAPTPGNRSGIRPMSRAASIRTRCASGPGSVDHLLEQHSRRRQVLRGPGMRQVGHEGRADREVGEVAQLLDSGEGIQVRVAGEVEQRLGADLEVGIAKQPLDRPRTAVSPAAFRMAMALWRTSGEGCSSRPRTAGCVACRRPISSRPSA